MKLLNLSGQSDDVFFGCKRFDGKSLRKHLYNFENIAANGTCGPKYGKMLHGLIMR